MIVKDMSQNRHEIEFRQNNGQEKVACPKCSKTKSDKPLSWNHQKGVGTCHRCEEVFLTLEAIPYMAIEKKVYEKPKFINKTDLSENIVKWFEKRLISQKSLLNLKVSEGIEFMPQVNKEVNTLQFNYFKDGELINIKYRDGAKNFKLHKNAELIPYNFDAILNDEIIIVEGEIDCLTVIECGFENVISVPNGASKNTKWLDDYIQLFDNKKIILAVDNDEKGYILQNELVRRFGAENCRIVNFKDCKDANDYAIKYGLSILKLAIEQAKHIKIDGTFELTDFEQALDELYKKGLQPGLGIGYDNLDSLMTYELQRLMVVTGIPGHGKSEFVDELCTRMNFLHQWKAVYFSPENRPLQIHASKIIRKISGKQFNAENLKENLYMQTKEYVNDNFFFIVPEDNFKLDNILEKAKYLIKTRGVKILVIDPWNRIETNSDPTQNEIRDILVKLSSFAIKNDIFIILVAHPVKMKKDAGGLKYEIPTMYSINGSSHFFNIVDYGVTVYRDAEHIEVHVQKVKFEHLGHTGLALFKRNMNNGRYEQIQNISDIPDWRNYSYFEGVSKKTTPYNLINYSEPIKEDFVFGEEPPF